MLAPIDFLPYINYMDGAVPASNREIEMQATITVTINGREYDMDAVRNLMDDELCNQIHGTVDSEQEFVDAYLPLHTQKFGEEFQMS